MLLCPLLKSQALMDSELNWEFNSKAPLSATYSHCQLVFDQTHSQMAQTDLKVLWNHCHWSSSAGMLCREAELLPPGCPTPRGHASHLPPWAMVPCAGPWADEERKSPSTVVVDCNLHWGTATWDPAAPGCLHRCACSSSKGNSLAMETTAPTTACSLFNIDKR